LGSIHQDQQLLIFQNGVPKIPRAQQVRLGKVFHSKGSANRKKLSKFALSNMDFSKTKTKIVDSLRRNLTR